MCVCFKNIKAQSSCIFTLCAAFLVLTFVYLLGTSYSRFPEWDIPLSEFAKTAQFLEANDGVEIKKLQDELARRRDEDSEIKAQTWLEGSKPEFATLIKEGLKFYDFNRVISKQNPQIFLPANLVRFPEQDFILTALPRIREQVTELYMNLLLDKPSTRVWVSVLDSSEEMNACNNFWHPDYMRTLPLRDNWKLIESSTTLLREGAELSVKSTKTTLTKTTLVFSNGEERKTIHHLHYNGWFDHFPCPDGGLLMLLLSQMEALNKQAGGDILSERVPIIINCIGGVGRSGETTAGYVCYRRIRTCPKNRRAAMTLNIPEIVYAVRKQRYGAIRRDTSVISLYKIFGRYDTLLTDS